jgi:hypothetical protein
MEIDAYRASAEAFVSELTAEYYRHFAGLTDTFVIEAVYARHAALFSREEVEGLRAAAASVAAGTDDHRQLAFLVDFAVEGYVGAATQRLEAQLAEREAGLAVELDGAVVGFREAPVTQMNEPDSDRRAAIEQARMAATDEHLNPLYRELQDQRQATSRELGYGSYRELCAQTKGLDLDALHAQTAAFQRDTDADYPRLLEPELRRAIGVEFRDLRRSDLPRFFRAPAADAYFPADRLVDSFVATMDGLGIDVADQPGVVFDVESRPGKTPRAFCAPVRCPGEVYLVIAPAGGWDDYGALFHEGGHTEHFASVDQSLPFEFRLLGDNAITECFAFLFEHLVENAEWLSRRLSIEDPGPIVAHARAQRLVYLRRYAAKLAYERELHAGRLDLAAAARRYSELLGGALGVEWRPESFLSDVDAGFYCACYLRAWALETRLRRYLTDAFGPAWFESRAAGEELRALWREGQRWTPEALLARVGGGDTLDFGVLRADLGLA